MATGYTAKLVEKGQPFEEFVMQCARAFGALVEMRDEPLGASIPKKFEPNNYYAEKLAEINKKLKRLKAMTPKERIALGTARKTSEVARCKGYLETGTQENNRLEAMRVKVLEWKPPTDDHQGLKEFMLDQIKISMNDMRYSAESLAKAEQKDPMVFYTDEVENAESQIRFARYIIRRTLIALNSVPSGCSSSETAWGPRSDV